MCENICIFDINRKRFSTISLRYHICLRNQKHPLKMSSILLTFFHPSITEAFKMQSGHTKGLSLSITVLHIIIFINTPVNVQKNISSIDLLDEFWHELGQFVLSIEVLLATHNTIDTFYVQYDCWSRWIGIKFILGGHAPSRSTIILKNPPLIIE